MKEYTLKRTVLIEKQLFPKRYWCLYFDEKDEPNLVFYDGAIGREDRIMPDGQVMITITEPNGYRQKQWDEERLKGVERIGDVIVVPRNKLKLGFQPYSHYTALARRIKDIVPNEYLIGDEVWREIMRITSACGIFEFIEKLNLNGGIIDKDMIESAFSNDVKRYPLMAGPKNLSCIADMREGEIISPREAMKRFGHKVLDEVYERTICHIENVTSPIETWHKYRDSFGYEQAQINEIQKIKEGRGFNNIFAF